MSKEIVMLVMSKFSNKGSIEYNDSSGGFKEVCTHTNEASLKYMIWKLRKEHKKIDMVYAFVSKEVEPELDRFKSLFIKEHLEIKTVPMYDVNLSGSFKSISMMADILHQYDNVNENKLNKTDKNNKKLTIHVDLTGGPRHSVMLMMALIQIVKFTGAKIGMVTYANILNNQYGLIEDTHELMNLFTLISGADKFVSFGDVSQIKDYFKDRENNSESLNKVLTAMENLSETIKVCGSYPSMTNTLDTLYKTIQEYEQFYEKNKPNLSEQEVFFGKLLPTIRNEYQDIMPIERKNATPVEIIRWCVKRSFLQQATVFYTEWLPDYLINNNLVEVTKQEIINKCEASKLEWSSYSIYLFKSYNPSIKKSILQQETNITISKDKLTYDDIKNLIQRGWRASEILIKIRNKNEKFEAFIRDLIKFEKKTSTKNFAGRIMNLADNDIKKVILKIATPNNTSLENYLNKRIKVEIYADKVILSALKNIKKEKIYEFFDLEPVTKNEKNIGEKGQNRAKVFEQLLKSGDIITKLPKENLIKFANQYSEYVSQWRNKFSHANSDNSNKENNINIVNSLIESVELIEIKK